MADKAISELVRASIITGTDLFVLQQDNTAKCLPGQVLLNWLTAAADGHGGIADWKKIGTSGLVDTYRVTLADTTTFDYYVTNGKAISSVKQTSVSGLTRTYTIAFNDGTTQQFTVTDGRGILSVEQTSVSGLTRTYTISFNDGTTESFEITDGRSFVRMEKTGTNGLVDTYTIFCNDGSTETLTVTNGEKGDKGDRADIWVRYASQKPTESSHNFGELPDTWIGIATGHNMDAAPTDWKQYIWYQWKGEKGDTGDPATLVNSEIRYQVGDSGTIIPSGTWSTSVPVVAQGRYLWTRTTNTFNTGNPVVSYSVSRMGLDGSGSVSSVANISPDENGNVPLTAANIGALPNTGGDMTGEMRMNGNPIRGLNMPTENDQAANMGFVNQQMKRAAPLDLLTNSDWRVKKRIINQRGKTTYNNGYTIDRWFLWHDGNGASLTINDGYIAVSFGNNGSLNQRLSKGILDPTETYTLVVKHKGEDFPRISYDKVYFESNYDYVTVLFGSGELEYARLFKGKYTLDTIPEHPSNCYGAELVECQRYYKQIKKVPFVVAPNVQGSVYYSNSVYFGDMRVKPTVTIVEDDNGHIGVVQNVSYISKDDVEISMDGDANVVSISITNSNYAGKQIQIFLIELSADL